MASDAGGKRKDSGSCEQTRLLSKRRSPSSAPDPAISHETESELQSSAVIDAPGPKAEGPGLFITGLGEQYPEHVWTQEAFEGLIKKWIVAFPDAQNIKKLLFVNRNSGIKTRSCIFPVSHYYAQDPTEPLPTIDDYARVFRKHGVQLAVDAARKALLDANIKPGDITHTVGVTCTTTSNPGFDLHVLQALGVPANADRVLLHGVGCAGGLSALRNAANLAAGASHRKKPARILVFAVELCSFLISNELARACDERYPTLSIGAAIFADGAGAFVLCNEIAMAEDAARHNGEGSKGIYEILDYGNSVLESSLSEMSFDIDPHGFQLTLTKAVPERSVGMVPPIFARLSPSYTPNAPPLSYKDVDWALHPGGSLIIQGAKKLLGLTSEQLRASWDVYENQGNSSSATVLIVLNRLRNMGEGKENVAAVSFGPGLSVEMAALRRCR